MFSARPSAEHSARKRLISHVYSKSYIQSSPATSAQGHAILSERLLPILEKSTKNTQLPHGIDIYSVFMAATMDFIAGYIFGLKNGTDFLNDKAYREHFLELYRARNGYGFYDQEMPQITRLCRKIGIPFCPKWVDAANKELGEWCLRLCDQISSSYDPADSDPKDEPVVWQSLVGNLQKEESTKGKESLLYPTALSNFRLSVASELFDHVLAGQETAGLALTYLTWRLSQSLELQEQLRTELLNLTPNMRRQADGTMSMPDPKQLDNLPLLHAVLTETLRLHAPIPGPQPRQTPEAGCRLGSYYVPGGVRVAALAYTLHRDETVFPEAEKWDHTRWLPGAATDEERKQRNRLFWAFGSGGRMCIGSNFAMHEMKLMIAAIYSNYTSHIVDDDGVADQSDGYTSRPANEQLYLRFEKVAI
ncbi:cytochrome P450 [Apiosordaria backusii]|uniref:Cytochrome P450 n=1 Tax=Apiosordaria backusii TaxID=314023 RepID=A0AA40DI91_9PEZI|nr:cytochrome P450 [Apiosordaria backusii]